VTDNARGGASQEVIAYIRFVRRDNDEIRADMVGVGQYLLIDVAKSDGTGGGAFGQIDLCRQNCEVLLGLPGGHLFVILG
jgi:hypothetical protein